MQFFNNGTHCCLELRITIAEVFHSISVHMVAFHDGVYMRLYLTAKESLVVLAGLHHNGEVCQLRCTVIDVQTIDVVLYNACNCRSGINTISLIYLNEHVKHISQNVAAAGARVDAQNILWFQSFVLFTNRRKLSLNVGFLLCLFQIVLPLRFQCIVRMTF